jgi:16S rRNA (guanine527-N7)-methyltransferase
MNDMIVQHLLDSLAIAPFVRGRSLLDIGSGGGFPGMPLAIVDPSLAVTLLDSRGKRIEFLRYACATLGIGNVQLARQRAEDCRPGVKFDTLATRAFASLADTLKLTAGLHQPGCRMLAMKGKIPDREIELLDPVFRDRVTIEKLNVPFLAAERHLIIIEF